MNGNTKFALLALGGLAAYLYYKRGDASAGNPSNAETAAELLASTNATIRGQMNFMATQFENDGRLY